MTSTTLPPLDRATRRPASAVTSSSLPTTAIRRPPPALEQASTSAPLARGSTATIAARHASYPSSTSPVPSGTGIVVGCDAEARMRPSARPTSAALVNVEPKSTQTARSPVSAEGTVEVGDQVLGGLDADAQAHQVGGHLQVGAGDAGVGHPAGVLDQRLHAAEGLAQGEDLGLLADRERLRLAAGDPEGDHPAEALHLLRRDLVPRVLLEAGVDHPVDRGVAE